MEKTKLIRRKEKLDYLHTVRDKPVIKVITGIRRCGKSTLLSLFVDDLLDEGVGRKQIQTYNFEKPEDFVSNDWREFYRYIVSKLDISKPNYIFIDEPQELDEFERLLDGLYVNPKIDLYVTGSNARFLSSDLATLLSGRYIELRLTPFSLAEFVSAQGATGNERDILERYLFGTSFPAVADEAVLDSEYVNNYLGDVINSVLENDVYKRFKIKNKPSFDNILKYVIAHIGSVISPNGIADELTRKNKQVNIRTVERYLEAMTSCYILDKVNRFDIRGKQQLATLEKYYVADVGIRRLLVGRERMRDSGYLLENVVYFELLRRGGRIWVGKSGEQEVDFVVQKPYGGIEYYQVAYTAKEERTLERELRPLKQIRDHYPKYLLTTDELEFDEAGIMQRNVVKWLLG